ncbi:MAG: acylphosphatase [Syntrophales bacterium]
MKYQPDQDGITTNNIHSNKRVHVVISGRVQGVNFRYATEQKAQSLGLTGWVRNLHDGRVEAIFEGQANAVDAMVEWCRTGPPIARVTGIEKSEEPYMGQFDDFRITF